MAGQELTILSIEVVVRVERTTFKRRLEVWPKCEIRVGYD